MQEQSAVFVVEHVFMSRKVEDGRFCVCLFRCNKLENKLHEGHRNHPGGSTNTGRFGGGYETGDHERHLETSWRNC